ncbi:MAG: hypothetical protein NVV60_11815 [Luteimonas sp.]|nr:hypothetical protein [Luteimonas sp.]
MGDVHPHVAIMAFDGWLLGGDQGEFGGAIVHEQYGKPQSFLANANVEDIFEMPFGFVATTSYSHLVNAEDSIGSLILITQRGNEEPVAVKIHDLPAAASSSWLLENGSLLINTANGSVLLDLDGSLQSIQCASTRQTDA